MHIITFSIVEMEEHSKRSRDEKGAKESANDRIRIEEKEMKKKRNVTTPPHASAALLSDECFSLNRFVCDAKKAKE